jgi:hypothetical protein
MKNLIGLVMIIVIAMTSCDGDNSSRNAASTNVSGSYVLTSLVANVAVDFNQDGVTDTELINEAVCFPNMSVDFMANGDFTAIVAEPDFDSMNVLSCPTSMQTGTYILDTSNLLTLVIDVNGGTITEDKQVVLTATTFEFTVTGQDLNQYISDRVGTPAGSINSLQVVYTKI